MTMATTHDQAATIDLSVGIVADPIVLLVASPPVAKARARVTMRGGRARTYTPRKTEEAEWRIRQQFIAEHPGFIPLEGPIHLAIVARVTMPASMPKKRRDTARPVTRPDVDNYAKTVLDALNGAAFRDDSQVVTLVCRKRYAREQDLAGWEIFIQPLAPP